MRHEPFLNRVAEPLAAEPAVAALFLAGSYGSGTADAYSDIDLVAIAPAEAHGRVAALWRAGVERVAEVVLWNERRARGILLNAITADWLRVDLHIVAAEDFTRRSKASVKPVFDRGDLYAGLPESLPPARPDPERVRAIVNEFIRVMGLASVGLGRGEFVMCVKGAGLLRDLLIDLMLEECPLPDRGGVLHLKRLLPQGEMALLEALPYPRPEREAVIEAHVAMARAFFPIARRLSDELGVAWPERFEAATRRHLLAELGVDLADVSRAEEKEPVRCTKAVDRGGRF